MALAFPGGPARTSQEVLAGSRILVVDDEPANVRLLTQLLTKAGYQVTGTNDPRQVVDLVSTGNPDLLILDLHMPHLDGFEVMRSLGPVLSPVRYLPILILTADTSSVVKQRALGMGARDFLGKPFDRVETLLRIRNLLTTRHLYTTLEQEQHRLEAAVRERTRELADAHLEIVDRLARAAEYRDDNTGTPSADREPPEQTEVHRFDITGTGAPRYVASGVVPGRLLNQYSLSDHEGNLRVATTSSGDAAARSSSGVYVLKADTLAKVGQVTGLGRGERIYSVRFIGPVGYVVTFKQVDPLYTLDLRDPAQPEVTGELKITGYSAYLHPAGEGRLLGIGQEASAKGRTLGTQVSLFDVRDPATPARLSRFHQKDSGSEAEWDPHAFLYWPASGLAVLPINSWGRTGPSDRTGPEPAALVLKVSDASITKTGLITHPKTPRSGDPTPGDPRIRRVLVIGDTLWTFSDLGLKASDATTLAAQGWIPFPA